jgi:hypothetical protein
MVCSLQCSASVCFRIGLTVARYQGKVAHFQVDGATSQFGIEFEGGDVQFMTLPDDDVRLLKPTYGTFVVNGRTLVSVASLSPSQTRPRAVGAN